MLRRLAALALALFFAFCFALLFYAAIGVLLSPY